MALLRKRVSNGLYNKKAFTLATANLGNPNTTITACGGNNSFTSQRTQTLRIVIRLTAAPTNFSSGLIFEGGATVWGQCLYIIRIGNQSFLIFECGRGGNNQTGPTGNAKNERAYLSYEIPEGTINKEFIIELSSRSTPSSSSGSRMWVNGELVASDFNWATTWLAGGNGGGVCNGNGAVRATAYGTNGSVPALQNASLESISVWANTLLP